MTLKAAGEELPAPQTGSAARSLTTVGRLPRWFPAAVAGTIAVPVVVVLGFRALAGRLHPPTWPGTPGHPANATPGTLVAAALAAALFIAGWVWLRREAESGMRLRTAAGLALLWSLLLTLAPPLLSNDVYSYAAVGRLSVADLDPYRVGPSALGHGAFLDAVDPLWRHTPTPYGPLLVTLFHTTAWLAHGSVLATIVLLRLVAVAITLAAVALTVWAARPSDRLAVLLLTGLNPVLLLHLVSGTHLDALIGAAAVGVVVLAVAGRWVPAMVLAVLAGLIKAPAFALVAFVFFYVFRRSPPERRARSLAEASGAVVATLLVAWVALPNAFGWVKALAVPAAISNPRVPSVWLAWVMRGVAALAGTHLSGHTASTISRAITLVIGGIAALVLLYRAGARADRGHALRYVGWALLVVAITGPVVYGWYLAWGLLPAAAGSRPGRERMGLVAVSAVCFALTVPAMKIVPGFVQWAMWLGAGVLWWLAAGRPWPARRAADRVPAA